MYHSLYCKEPLEQREVEKMQQIVLVTQTVVLFCFQVGRGEENY